LMHVLISEKGLHEMKQPINVDENRLKGKFIN